MGNIWLDFDFQGHWKVKKLKRILGAEGVLRLLKLWTYAAQHNEDGELTDMSDVDIEDVCEWVGSSGRFVVVLIECKLLKKEGSTYYVHNFIKNNPYIIDRKNKSKQAQKAANVRWGHKKKCNSNAEAHASAMPMHNVQNANETKRNETKLKLNTLSCNSTNSDDDAQAKVVNTKKTSHKTAKEIGEILDHLNRVSDKKFKVGTKATRAHIKARMKEGFVVSDFKKVIDKKVVQWGADPVMAGFIRPITLFGTKFEGYLNEANVTVDNLEVNF